MNISLQNFEQTIKACRCKETSGDPEKRSDNNPSYRQCLFTALLANELLGLDVYSEKIIFENKSQEYHYFNKDTIGREYRFCEEQFDHEIVIKRMQEKIRSKERIEAFLVNYPQIKQTYQLLKHKFQTEIQKILNSTA